MKHWGPTDLDEIITYGDVNYRKQINRFHRHAIIKPPEIKFKVYTSRAKIFTEIGAKTVKGIFDAQNTKDLVDQMGQMLSDYTCIIFTYCEQSYAIWKENNAVYIFNSEDTDENGNLVEKRCGACCVIRSPESIAQIVEYLAGQLRIPKKRYEIYSFKINEKVSIEQEIGRLNPVAAPQKEPEVEPEPEVQESESRNKIAQRRQTAFIPRMFEQQPEPDFTENFQTTNAVGLHGYLECEDHLTKSQEDARKAPFVSCTAIAMLRLCKSSLWKAATIKDIFKIGREIFKENVEEVLADREARKTQLMKDSQKVEPAKEVQDEEEKEAEEKPVKKHKKEKPKRPESIEKQADIPITELRPVVTLKKTQYEIHTENVVFGKILKRGNDSMSLEEGIKSFFKSFDCGVIQGPDVVAVWREKNNFFMFDPNPCEGFERTFDSEANSCLNWFKNLEDLVKVYVANIPKDNRNSIFKVAKVETVEHVKKSDDWQRFKAIGTNKWILTGTISESSDEFQLTNRNHQSTCMSVVALAKTRELGIQSWTRDTVDEIVQMGDEFYIGSVMLLKEQEKFVDQNLRVSEVGPELRLERMLVDLVFDEGVVNGNLMAKDDEELSLAMGLGKFFEDDDLAVVTACEISLAVWKREDVFYLFDSHNRDDFGRNLRATGEF